MFTITKQFHFSAAHQLNRVPAGHPCGRLHGHNYIVEVVLQSDGVTDQQWVRDFGELDHVKDFLKNEWDHRNLNDWFERFSKWEDGKETETTAEMLAFVLFEAFRSEYPELLAVRVSETPKTWAEYRVSAHNNSAMSTSNER